MPTFRKKKLITAEQWFPSHVVKGVCTCAKLLGPHVHTAHQDQAVSLSPGDWVVPESNGDGYYPIKPDIMQSDYDRVD